MCSFYYLFYNYYFLFIFEKDTGEVAPDEGGGEAPHMPRVGVQEHDVHDVVADVPLALHLEGRKRKN